MTNLKLSNQSFFNQELSSFFLLLLFLALCYDRLFLLSSTDPYKNTLFKYELFYHYKYCYGINIFLFYAFDIMK